MSDWSSDVCSSDLVCLVHSRVCGTQIANILGAPSAPAGLPEPVAVDVKNETDQAPSDVHQPPRRAQRPRQVPRYAHAGRSPTRSEERRVGQEGVSTGRTRWSPYM